MAPLKTSLIISQLLSTGKCDCLSVCDVQDFRSHKVFIELLFLIIVTVLENSFLLHHSDPETELIYTSCKTQLSTPAIDRVSINGRD